MTEEKPAGLKVLAFVVRQLLKYRYTVAAVVAASFIVAVSELFSIALLVPFIESLGQNGHSAFLENTPIGFLLPYFSGMSVVDKVRIIAVFLLVVELIKGGMRYLSGIMGYILQNKVDSSLRQTTMDHLMKVGLGFIHKQQIANLFTILNNFTGNASKLALLLVSAVPDLFQTVISIAVLFTISPSLTLIGLVLSVFISVILGRLSKMAHRFGKQMANSAIAINQSGFEILSGMFLIRLFAREKTARSNFRKAVKDLMDARYRLGVLEAAINPLSTVLLVLIVVILLVSATYLLQKEAGFWMGILVIFLVVFSRLGGPLGRVNLTRTQLAELGHPIYSLIKFLDHEDKQMISEGTQEFGELNDSIRFEKVHFKYDSDEEEVLDDISFTVPKGKVTALVGASGSGKSTIIALLARLYDPTGGRVSIDGTDMRHFISRTWRRNIGVVTQRTFLFNDTLRNNITFGKPEATDEEVEEAVRQANALDFIKEMKVGYDTPVGDHGVRLSGGQAQRIAIARAVLVDPQLLLFDEATSALDTASERLVQKAIDRLSKTRTVVVVAHRLSTIRDADNIIVLEKGHIVEQGRHEELVARKGSYWNFVRLQDLTPKSKDTPQ